MKTISDHAAAAKMIRKELKRLGVKASVKSRSYSMGNSIDIRISHPLGDAMKDQVSQCCAQFQKGDFNGMIDSYEYTNRREDLPQVCYVFVEFWRGEE